MALQAPERRGKSLQEDLERAYALSAAEKRLGPHFPPLENSSHEWQFDGTEHKGGGFDPDMYAYKTRGDIKREWEVSVVQWAREREIADQTWATEHTARGQDRGPKTVWAPEEADIREARQEVEQAWAREQRELEGLASPKSKGKERPKTYSVPVIPESVDARRLSEQHYRPTLRDENPAARTHAWLNGRGEAAGVREYRTDPTEQNEIHTMDLYDEELRLKRQPGLARKPQTPEMRTISDSDKQSDIQSDGRSEKQSERHARRYSAPVRQISKGSSSKPPTLPSKIFRNGDLVETPRSESTILSPGTEARVNSRISKASEPRVPSRRRSVASQYSIPQSIPYSEEIEHSIPPSLPSKDSRPGSPDSMATESRQTIRSAVETEPEPIHVFSPTAEDSPTIHIQPRPASSRTKRGDSLLQQDKDSLMRPVSFQMMTANDSYPDLKQKDVVSIRTIEPEEHVRSSATSWINMPPPGSYPNERLLDETLIQGPHGHSELSMTTLVSGAERYISPAAQLVQQFRQQAQEAAVDPMNSTHLGDMSFTVPAMFSRSTVGIHEPVPEEPEEHVNIAQDDEIYTTTEEEPVTPRQRLSHIPHPIRLPQSGNNSSDSPNIDKSLPPTPYTTTHSNISQPQFDADALEAEQQTEASYYRNYRDSMPPDYTSGSKTPKGSYGKDSLDKTPHDSLVSLGTFKNHMKSNASLRSAKTGSTGAMGDVEPDEAPMNLRNAERRPSRRVKHRPKPEGSSDGSASTIKASNHARSNSSASESGSSHRARHERHQKRSEEHHTRSNSKRKIREGLPPGTSHTKISYSDSESEQSKEDAQTFGPEIIHKSSVDSSPLSVDASDDDAQYVMAPDPQESQAPGRLSAHTFGLPTGTSMAFRDSRDLRSLKDESHQTAPTVQSGPSRPLSMVPSMRSNRTRASTLRASMRSPPLPDISERDTTSELSDRGDIMALNGSGSLVGMLNVIAPGMGSSSEVLREGGDGGEDEGAAWRRDIWNAVARDAASTRRSDLAKAKTPVSRFSTTQGSAPASSRGHGSAHGHKSRSGHGHSQDVDDVKSSTSSLGEELKENFTLQHPPDSYHGSHRNSIAQDSLPDHQGRHSQHSQNSQQDSMARGSRRNSMPIAPGNHSSGSPRESMPRHSRRNSMTMAQGHSSGMEEREQGSSGRGTGVNGAPGVGTTGHGSGSGSGNKGYHSSSTGNQRSTSVGAWVEWNEDSEVGMAGVGAHGHRAKVAYKEPTPVESDNYWSD